MHGRKVFLDFLVPIAILLVGTALIAATGFDLAAERYFYTKAGGWLGVGFSSCSFLYRFGVLPGYFLAVAGLLVFLASFFLTKVRSFRRAALFLVLLLTLGPGLTVNTFFKDHWGRPRPAHLQIFDGMERMPFHQMWEPGIPGEGKSFPCGHASAAFYLFAPYFVFRSSDPRKGRWFLALGLGYGVVMGLARMAMGGHFPSDVLWSGGLVYLVGLSLCYLMKLDLHPPVEVAAR